MIQTSFFFLKFINCKFYNNSKKDFGNNFKMFKICNYPLKIHEQQFVVGGTSTMCDNR